jgi:hypothetical protein
MRGLLILLAGCGFSAPSGPGIDPAACDISDPSLRLCVDFDQLDDVLGHPVMDAVDVSESGVFGATSELRFAEASDLDVDALTIDMWIAPSMGSGWLLDNNTEYFIAYAGKRIRCGIGAQAADSGEEHSIEPDGMWHHVACTYGADHVLRTFVDGDVRGCRSIPSGIPTSGDLGTAIGANYGSGGYTDRFVGALRNVHVLARALAPDDVCNAAHRTGCNTACPDE